VEGFLKKHQQEPAFDHAGKEIPPHSGLCVPKKTHNEVTQWQGKEMRNLGRWISAVLASALPNPDSSQYYNFKSPLKYVSALVDFSLMAQYCSHTPDTLLYRERYLQTFHRTKDMCLEFRTSKAKPAEANRQDCDLRELMANQHANEIRHNSAAKRSRQVDQERVERALQRVDLIRHENHFTFIKMHYLSDFASHVRHFGSISMYSIKIGELAHKEQIKDGYRNSNENEAARQSLSQYEGQHALRMPLQTIEALLKTGVIVVGNSGMEMPTSSSRTAPRRMLEGRTNIATLSQLCRAHKIKYCNMMEEMLPFIKQTTADDPRLPADPTELGLLPVERFTQLETPVSDVQEADGFHIHGARCTGTKAFGNARARNHWVWVQTGGVKSYGDLRGRAVARLLALFKIRNVLSEAAGVYRLTLVRMVNPINGSRFHLASGHIPVGKRSTGPHMRIVNIGAVIGQAHVIPSSERQCIVDHKIDLWMFNDID